MLFLHEIMKKPVSIILKLLPLNQQTRSFIQTEGILSMYLIVSIKFISIIDSACYAFLKQWQKAFDDGLQSISKDPKFLKGYYRLATAQAELKQFDDAETTLRAALALEPGNYIIISFLINIL